jgi:hypothetical protein
MYLKRFVRVVELIENIHISFFFMLGRVDRVPRDYISARMKQTILFIVYMS